VRKTTRIGLAAPLIAGVLALASPQFSSTFDMTYLSRAPGAASGQVPLMTWSDPGAPNGVPKIVKRIVMTFARGTRFDTAALPRCHATDAQLKATGPAACPKASRLGAGHTTAVFSSGDELVTDVTLFNARGQIVVVVQVNGTVITEFRDRVAGRTISIEPVLPAGVALTRLKLRIPRHGDYQRNPPTCPKSGKWTTVARFTYVGGSTETHRDTTPCRRP
jgi:hypothetical protein